VNADATKRVREKWNLNNGGELRISFYELVNSKRILWYDPFICLLSLATLQATQQVVILISRKIVSVKGTSHLFGDKTMTSLIIYYPLDQGPLVRLAVRAKLCL